MPAAARGRLRLTTVHPHPRPTPTPTLTLTLRRHTLFAVRPRSPISSLRMHPNRQQHHTSAPPLPSSPAPNPHHLPAIVTSVCSLVVAYSGPGSNACPLSHHAERRRRRRAPNLLPPRGERVCAHHRPSSHLHPANPRLPPLQPYPGPRPQPPQVRTHGKHCEARALKARSKCCSSSRIYPALRLPPPMHAPAVHASAGHAPTMPPTERASGCRGRFVGSRDVLLLLSSWR